MSVIRAISNNNNGVSSVTYFYDDGSIIVYRGGSRSWRNNNPGNLVGAVDRRIGTDYSGMDIYPDLITGEASRRRMFEHGGKYYGYDSIRQMLTGLLDQNGNQINNTGYAPKYDENGKIINNPDLYADQIKKWTGIDVDNIPIASLTAEQRGMLEHAMKRKEGWKEGAILEFDPSGHLVAPYVPGPFTPDVYALNDMTPFVSLWNDASKLRFRDPLILDLDNDGIETTNVKDGAYFDHDGNGFAEQTGWASSDDGLLVMDRDGDGIINDGTELFGDQTILQNGQRATDGFQALAELDSNADGIIDINDTQFSQLKVWQDLDCDGYSASDELFTLQEMGIQSINVAHTDTNTVDPQGNTQVQTGTFTKTDGSTAAIGGFNLQRDTTYTIADDWLDVPDDITLLPDLQGYGNTYDLHQAIVRDTTGTLKSLIEQFVASDDSTARDALMEQILFKWTSSDAIDPDSRGTNFEARKYTG